MMSPDVYVVVLNWNRADDTLDCLHSLVVQQDITLHIILVDNGSTDDSVARIKAVFPKVEILSTGTNLGFPGGMNVGIRVALNTGAENILLLNNDTIADPFMVRCLMNDLKPEVGCAAPAIYYAGAPEIVWSTGGNINFVLLEMGLDRPKETEISIAKTFFTGCALLVRRTVFEQVGLFDERFFPGYYEDLDFSLRVSRAGIRMVLSPKARLWHKVSQSSGGSSSPRVRFLMARNSAWYFRKHMRWWQIFPIISFRLLSAIKMSFYLLFKRDWKGLHAHWIGIASGWLNIHLPAEKGFLGSY